MGAPLRKRWVLETTEIFENRNPPLMSRGRLNGDGAPISPMSFLFKSSL